MCSSHYKEDVCLVPGVRLTLQEGIFGSGGESREKANVGEEAAGSVPEERRRRKMKWPRQTAIWLRICSLGILQSF